MVSSKTLGITPYSAHQFLAFAQASPRKFNQMSRRIVVPILEIPYCSLLASDALCRISLLRRPISLPTRLPVRPTRSLSSCTSNQDKAIVLEKPDKFRPPSHPARLNARRIPRHYPGPPILEAEKEAQATRKYPHTFPNEGTKMYWFLTNRYVHLWISLVGVPPLSTPTSVLLSTLPRCYNSRLTGSFLLACRVLSQCSPSLP